MGIMGKSAMDNDLMVAAEMARLSIHLRDLSDHLKALTTALDRQADLLEAIANNKGNEANGS